MKKVHRYSTPRSTAGAIQSKIATVDLETEYRLTREALVNAGLDMTDSMDALYRDWRRWRDQPKFLAPAGAARVDQWWARHLAQFQSLIDPPHVAARAERTLKDQSAVRSRPVPAASDSLIGRLPG